MEIHIVSAKTIFRLPLILFFLWLAACGGGGSAEETISTSCPAAQDVYDHVQQTHQEARENLYFGSEWEITFKNTLYWPPQLEKHLQLLGGPLDDSLDGAVEYSGTTLFMFSMPEEPTPISCSDIETYIAEGVSDTESLKLLVMLDYYDRLYERLSSRSGVAVQGTGNHSSSETPSLHTDRIVEFSLLCYYDNPCTQDRYEEMGCNATTTPHTVNANFFIDWTPGENATFDVDIDSYVPDFNSRTQVTREGSHDFELSTIIPGDVCASMRPICLGTITGDTSCGLRFQSFAGELDSNEPEIFFQPGEQLNYQSVTDIGEVRTKQVTLNCTSGCECIASADCDDGKVCTRDNCNRGNCENTADDTIQPDQVANDCRYCENGELQSVREQVERECDQAKANTVSSCATNDDWRVHWVKEFGSAPAETAHYCEAGIVPGDSTITICDGEGACGTNALSTYLDGHVDKLCHNYAGKDVQFTCNVFCTRCE